MRALSDWEETLLEQGCFWQPCGSRVTCSVVREDSDWDYLVLCGEGQPIANLLSALNRIAINDDVGNHHYQTQAVRGFISFKRPADMINLIVTTNYEFFRRHILATEICKAMDVLDKRVRIQIFQRILYGNKINVEDT